MSFASRQLRKYFGAACITLSTLALVSCGSGGGGGSPAPVAQTPVSGGSEAPPATAFLLNAGARSLVKATDDSAAMLTLRRCVVAAVEGRNCTLGETPLIGMNTTNPSVDDIMQKVLVSHDWMRLRFRQILETMPREVLLMTRGLTAIVISYDIRPSFYYPHTGAIYLDPEGMWLTEAERSVIDTTPDYRGEFAKQLDFIMLWRYVQGNTDTRSLDRNLQSVSLRTASLLYHELAHANDFFAPARTANLNRNVAIVDAITALESDRLAGTYPLRSDLMKGLAAVSFQGDLPTPVQAAYTSEDIAAEFPTDVANDFYNYNTQFEDLAMAFEEAMLWHSFGVSRDVAVTNYPDSNTCADYVVAWGQRNRIANPVIQARAMLTVRSLLPEVADAVEDSLARLSGPIQMTAGTNWCQSINLSSNPTGLQFEAVRPHPTVEVIRPYE